MGAYLLWGNSSLYFDVVTNETQIKSCFITEHPVEDGADVTDHVRPNLDKVTLEAFISNAPLTNTRMLVQHKIPLEVPSMPAPFPFPSPGLLTKAVDGLLKTLDPRTRPTVANVNLFGNPSDLVHEAIANLENLRVKAVIVSVICPNYTYNNMIIESFEVHRDPHTGTGATFAVDLRELRFVKSSVGTAPLIPRAAPAVPKGHQAAQEAPVPNSIAFNLANS